MTQEVKENGRNIAMPLLSEIVDNYDEESETSSSRGNDFLCFNSSYFLLFCQKQIKI